MLLLRLNEVGALAQLDEVSKSQVFLAAAGNSVLNVGKGVASAVKDPGATAKGIGGGVKRFGTNLGRKAKRTGEQAVDAATSDDEKDADGKSTTDKAAAAGTGMAYSVLGVNKAARKWAQKVGADPYTTNPILKKALTDIGQIDAAGGIAAKVVVPIPMVVSSTATVGNLVWSKPPEDLMTMNEQNLKKMGVGGDTIKQLSLSKGFTLTLYTRFATNLSEVNVPGGADYASTAAEAKTEREAEFFTESAQMLARFHKTAPVAAVLPDSRALVAKTKDGRAVVLLPVDWVRWTEAYEKALTEIEKRAKQELGATKLELHMTGTMSAVAKKEMAARGWTVVENVPSTIEVVLAKAARRRRPRRSSPMTERGAWRLLAALAALNVLGYVDRQLVAALAPVLMAELGLSRADIGFLIGPAFVVVFALGTLVLGAAADRWRRPRIIAGGLAAWSAATALTGTASGFATLAFWRALVGVGEATLPPTAIAMLGDRFPPSRLGFATSVYYAGIPVGFACSLAVAGWIVPRFGWHACFFLLGALGLAAVGLVWRMEDPPRRGALDGPDGPGLEGGGTIASRLRRAFAAEPTLLLLVAGATLLVYQSASSQHLVTWLVQERGFAYSPRGVPRVGRGPRGGARRQSRSRRAHRRGAAPAPGRAARRLRPSRGRVPRRDRRLLPAADGVAFLPGRVARRPGVDARLVRADAGRHPREGPRGLAGHGDRLRPDDDQPRGRRLGAVDHRRDRRPRGAHDRPPDERRGGRGRPRRRRARRPAGVRSLNRGLIGRREMHDSRPDPT